MNCALTPFAVTRLWANAFAENRLLKHWAESNYGKPFAIQIGADMRRPPNADDAPFLTLFPDAGQTVPQRAAVSSEIGIVAGVCNEEFVDMGGVLEMLGLARLNELCPLLESAMRDALPKARVQEISTEFEIMQYPLCMALLTVTVEESLPIGRR